MRVYQFHHIRVVGSGRAGSAKDYTHRWRPNGDARIEQRWARIEPCAR